MLMEQAIKNYEQYLISNRRAANTIKNYIATIRRLEIVAKIKTVSEINTDKIVEFKNAEMKRGIGGTTLNTVIAALKSFFTYLFEAGHISEDFAKKQVCKSLGKDKADAQRGIRQAESSDEPAGKAITAPHRKKILEACAGMLEGERNALMFEVGWVCGFRLSDLIALKTENFIFDEKDLGLSTVSIVMQKTRRRVKFCVGHTALMQKLRQYIEGENLDPGEYLFVTSRNAPLSTTGFQRMFESVLDRADLSGEYAPHDLRRTCATVLWKTKKMSLKEISMRLGHKSVVTTEIYLRLRDQSYEDFWETRTAVHTAF